MKNNIYLFVGATALLLGVFIAGTGIYKRSQAQNYTFLAKENSEVFVREHSPRMGSEDARVFLIEYLDPECESCRMFYPVVKKIMEEYSGKIQLVVRYAPFHRNSKHAIRVLEATKEQGKYWEALGFLFENQPKWADHHNPKPEMVYELLPQIGIDIAKLKEDMKNPKIDKVIEQDYQDLKTLNVRGTPSFFVNGKKPEGFGYMPLKKLIESEVAEAYKD